jgi:hypothetical protein
MFFDKSSLPTASEALPGRSEVMSVPNSHYVYNGHRLEAPFPDGYKTAVFGLGCFWGAERKFLAVRRGLFNSCWLCSWVYT